MRTLHERAVTGTVQEALSVPEWRSALSAVLVAIRERRYPQWFVDFVVQRGRGDLDVVDAYCVAAVLARYRKGELSFFRVAVGSAPKPDADREGNQRLLRALPPPLTATVDPGTDDDGWFQDGKSSVPLEIGTTASSRTLMHLEFRDGLARWPYFCEHLLVAKRTDAWRPWTTGVL